MSAPVPIAVVGIGKIATDQHLPTIAASPRFRLAGAVSRHDPSLDVPVRADLAALTAAVPDLSAVAICTPPTGRLALIEQAFALGLDVLLEKPPAATLAEAERFATLAARHGRTLFQSWHSRCAPAVAAARDWLATRTIRSARIDWLEDVRVWHPGQDWIWTPGVGVFDPGINAFSVATRILPGALTVTAAALDFPADRAAPIAAELTLAAAGYEVATRFSFDQRGDQCWRIAVETDDGMLALTDGGARLSIDGADRTPAGAPGEYAALYDRFADLIAARESDVDLTPFRLVADSFLLADRRTVKAFQWEATD